MRFKFKYLYSWGVQLSLVAANGGSSSLFGSPVVCCGGFVCSSLHVQCRRHIEYTVSGGRDFAMKTVIHFFVETVSTVERGRGRERDAEQKPCIRFPSALVDVKISAPGA